MVKIGHGSTASDNVVLIDLGRRSAAGTPDIALYNGGFILRSDAGLLGSNVNVNWAAAIRGHESWDTTRRNHVMYETPTLHGFTVQTAWGEDNYWDVALRYAGEFNGVRVAFGIAYQEDSEFNAPGQPAAPGTLSGLQQAGILCDTRCDVKASDLKGSASVLHVPTGLFLTFAAGVREVEGQRTAGDPLTAYAGPDHTFWHLSGGVIRNFFGYGPTVLFGEYTYAKGGLEQASFIGTTSGYETNTVGGARTTSEMTQWGIGINQHIDAAAMEIFATYKVYSLEANGFTGGNVSLNKGLDGVGDFSAVIVGTRVSF
jgi:hypothetical protein